MLLDRITANSDVMLGKPCIKGTRITVELVLEKLGGGFTEKEVLEMYPHITREDILACLEYASLVVKNEVTM